MSHVEQQQEYLKKRHNHSWIPLSNLNRGTLFWAALQHPRHRTIYVRPYIVVAQGNFTYQNGTAGCMLAVAGLETNSGFGRAVYDENSQKWIRNIVSRGHRGNARSEPIELEQGREKDYNGDDTEALFVDEQSTWEPKSNTIVDLSTLLVIEGYSHLLCSPVGKLSCASFERLVSIMNQLRSLPMDNYSRVMTEPTRRHRISQMPGYVFSATKARFQERPLDRGINPASISIFSPNDGVHGALGLDTILPREVPRGEAWQYHSTGVSVAMRQRRGV